MPAPQNTSAPTPAATHHPAPPVPDTVRYFNPDDLSEIDSLTDGISVQSLELIYAPHAQHPQPALTQPPAQLPRTPYDITFQEHGRYAPAQQRASDDILLPPIALQRSANHGAPVHLPARLGPELRNIAGSPLDHRDCATFDQRLNSQTGGWVHGDETLPLTFFSSDASPLPLPTPEFDSTHRAMRVPVPREVVSYLAESSVPGDAGSSATASRMGGAHAEDSSENLLTCALPGHGSMSCMTAHPAGHSLALAPLVPNSAPAILYESPAEQHGLQAPGIDTVNLVGSPALLPL